MSKDKKINIILIIILIVLIGIIIAGGITITKTEKEREELLKTEIKQETIKNLENKTNKENEKDKKEEEKQETKGENIEEKVKENKTENKKGTDKKDKERTYVTVMGMVIKYPEGWKPVKKFSHYLYNDNKSSEYNKFNLQSEDIENTKLDPYEGYARVKATCFFNEGNKTLKEYVKEHKNETFNINSTQEEMNVNGMEIILLCNLTEQSMSKIQMRGCEAYIKREDRIYKLECQASDNEYYKQIDTFKKIIREVDFVDECKYEY